MSSKNFINTLFEQHQKSAKSFPDKGLAVDFVNGIFEFLFIPQSQKKHSAFEMARALESFKSHLSTLIYDVIGDGEKAQEITRLFFDEIPEVYEALLKDAEAILQFDPAA